MTLALASAAHAEPLPAGTRLSVRLETALSSRWSAVGDEIRATVIAPVRVGGSVMMAAGREVIGTVAFAGRTPDHRRALLGLTFSEMRSGLEPPIPIRARLVSLDDVREAVDADGRIVGAPRYRPHPGVVEALLLAAAPTHPLGAAVLEVSRLIHGKARRAGVDCRAGTEGVLELEAPLALEQEEPFPSFASAGAAPDTLAAAVQALPERARAGSIRHPADVTNLVFIGTREEIVSAFEAAGWKRADRPGLRADARIAWAVAEGRAYKTAPVSRLDVEGRPPDLVFEKQGNTICKRHHVRLWQRAETWEGRPLYLAAATHDVNIFFSRSGRRFTHRIEPWIDAERQKIVDDLAFAGRVDGWTLVERRAFPASCRNAVGDLIVTDGSVAVVRLSPPHATRIAG